MWYQRHRARIRVLAFVLVGVAAGLTCPHLPERYREPCRVAVRLYRSLP